jgi:serine/threonine-protein kinase
MFMGENAPGIERGYLMPLYPRSLRNLLNEHNAPILRGWVIDFGIKIAAALQYAHERNFIHRDLKPENILLDFANNPVVADWGLGQFIHQESKVLDLKTQGPIGTPYYCPFEQWSSGRCNAPGDVYSLGLILAELVSGKMLPINPPFAGIQQDVVANDSPAAIRFNATIKRMTNFLEANRHASMNDVIYALDQCR